MAERLYGGYKRYQAESYRELDWSEEYDFAINGDPNDTQSAL